MVLYTNNMNPKKIYINEEQLQRLNEDVYVSGLKRKKAKLSYDKRQNADRVRNMGNYNKAAEYFNKVAELDPNDQSAKEQFVYCYDKMHEEK